MTVRRLLVALCVVPLLSLVACGSDDSAGRGDPLVGTFRLAAGSCSAKDGATPKGTYFRMISPGGTVDKGKFFYNPDSPCKDQSFSVQEPGTDGGLVTGTYQPASGKAFDAQGNARAARVTKPGSFTAIDFAISTNEVDPQSQEKVPAPEIRVEDGRLTGQVTAWSAAWNNLYFNQGSPKPDGTSPGLTKPLSGTYDAATRRFTIEWSSQIVGGPFNRFTGFWHLEGTFEPRT